MIPIERVSARTRHRHQLDRAEMELLRLVTDERAWKAEHAAGLLRTQFDDDPLIRLLWARGLPAMQVRPIPVDRRALSTLDRALLEAPAHD